MPYYAEPVNEYMPLLQDDQLKPRSSKPTLRITTGSLDLPSPQTPPPELDQEYVDLLIRKIDRRLLPLMFITLALNFMEKIVLGNGSVYGLLEDINLSGSRFSTTASMFYVGYLLWEYPATIVIQALPVGLFTGLAILLWGVVVACTAFTSAYGHLLATRFITGALEAFVNPAFLYITAQWYTRDEAPRRVMVWFAGIGAGGVLGNLLSWVIGHVDMKPWRWMYAIFGSLAILWSIVIFLFLPNSVSTARYFTPAEKDFIERRIGGDSVRDIEATIDDWTLGEAVSCLLDPKTWFFTAIVFFGQVGNGSLQSMANLVLRSFGYTNLETSLVGIPFWIASLMVVLGAGSLASRYRNITTSLIAGLSLLPSVGYLIMLLGHGQPFRLIGYLLTAFAYAGVPLTLSLIAGNSRSITQKMTTTALIFIAGCIANIVGPQLYFARNAPLYHNTFIIMAVLYLCQCLTSLGLRMYLWRCNKTLDNEAEANRPNTPIIRESGVPSPVITREPVRMHEVFRYRL
ncbi:putative allantoate permease [Calycina marina]|uniref:Allantoate permease n=1 Tax=Calycina marina TaxID=1763456 RepID=A0A9P7Z110_9HELO|nr:putative allantoate permease [Calycina marina]